MAEMPGLNWRNAEVEEAMLGVARFWLERGVDGFRVDSAQQIMKDPLLRDNPPNPDAGRSAYKYLGGYDAQLHLYDKGHEDVHRVYRRFRKLLDEYGRRDGRGRVAIGEIHVFDRPDWGAIGPATTGPTSTSSTCRSTSLSWAAPGRRPASDGSSMRWKP